MSVALRGGRSGGSTFSSIDEEEVAYQIGLIECSRKQLLAFIHRPKCPPASATVCDSQNERDFGVTETTFAPASSGKRVRD